MAAVAASVPVDGIAATASVPASKVQASKEPASKGPASIVVLGDSLSAEYGLDRDTGWVALMRKRLAQSAPDYNVVNASISGETTTGGKTRLPAILARVRPGVVIVELGANDALRGIPLTLSTSNLGAIIESSQSAGAKVLVIGMRIPPNYGPDYAEHFFQTFAELAKQYRTAYVPFLLDGLVDDPSLFQADQIHPTAAAQPHMLDNVWPALKPMLKDAQ
ncbi:Esterase TesA [Pararobbsia alpina]|uniref:Esterase TesA n=2 Tax=Pararobbsia alpina TaxID=621374 RepID=A0A6S7BR31_9BURK|nr:Esterase TesA [Pararobbsia alpina]